jgi:hypothetical protein
LIKIITFKAKSFFMALNDAGGTSGGTTRFVLGIALFVAGLYLLLKNIYVQHSFGFSNPMYSLAGFSITSGMLLIPFVIGIGMLFFNYKNIIGWVLAVGAVGLIIVGVITSIHFTLAGMSAFDILIILVMVAGGLGLFLSSFRNYERR